MGSEAHFEDFHQLICGVRAQPCANKPSQHACITCPMTNETNNIHSHDQDPPWKVSEWILFWLSFTSYRPCLLPVRVQFLLMDLWAVTDLLYFVSQPSLLSLVNLPLTLGFQEHMHCPHAIPWGPNRQPQFIWQAIWSDWSWAHCLHPSIPAKPKFFHFAKLFQRFGTVWFPLLPPCQNLLPSETFSWLMQKY